MSDSIVDLEVIGGNNTHIDSPPASESSEEENAKMADIDDTLFDAIRTTREIQALLEEDRNRKTEFGPPMLPFEVPPAPVWPPMPPFGVSQDSRYQQHSPPESGRGARQRTMVQGSLACNASPPPHQRMANVPPENDRREFLALEVEVRGNTKNLATLHRTVHNIKDNVMIMEETFKRILEESANDIRRLGIQMSNFEGTLRALFSQMDELRKVVHNFMCTNAPVDNNTSNVHRPETTREAPQSYMGEMFSPEEPPPTPVEIRRPPRVSSLPLDMASSLCRQPSIHNPDRH